MGLDARRLWRFFSSGRFTLARLATLAVLVALSGCTPSIGVHTTGGATALHTGAVPALLSPASGL